jgi:hypothetical protein
MLSWCVIGYAVWLCQFHQAIEAIVQSAKLDKSIDLVCGQDNPGYARTLWERQDEFLKQNHPLTKKSTEMPGNMLSWANGSSLRGVASGADQIRQYHPALVILDEAAFLPEAAESFDTADPVASQIICVSSAGPGWFAEICMQILDQPEE